MMSIVADSALEAWAAAVWEISRKSDREVVHSIVSFPCDTTLGPEHEQVSQMLTDAGAWDVKQVADTIFPQSLYRPEAEEPAKALFENWNYARQVNRRRKGQSITYFDRLTHYPNSTGDFNQLQCQLEKLRSELAARGPYRAIYELGLTGEAELRLMIPGVDRPRRSFPCLSHVSLTLRKKTLHLMAQYRYQYMIRKALGNYLGLSRLLAFFVNELGLTAGRVSVTAAYARIDAKKLGGIKRWRTFAESLKTMEPTALEQQK